MTDKRAAEPGRKPDGITFEEELARHGSLLYTNVGSSMMPLLRQGRDLILIARRPQGRLKKYDTVLYKQGERYILHRILKVRKEDYVICGDHNWRREYGITDEQIIGILTAFVRDGKRIPVTDPKYRCYVHLWCDLFYVRAALLRCRAWLGKWKRKLLS